MIGIPDKCLNYYVPNSLHEINCVCIENIGLEYVYGGYWIIFKERTFCLQVILEIQVVQFWFNINLPHFLFHSARQWQKDDKKPAEGGQMECNNGWANLRLSWIMFSPAWPHLVENDLITIISRF